MIIMTDFAATISRQPIDQSIQQILEAEISIKEMMSILIDLCLVMKMIDLEVEMEMMSSPSNFSITVNFWNLFHGDPELDRSPSLFSYMFFVLCFVF